MPYVILPTKAKNDAWGFQSANNHKNNLDYLKAQLEILVPEDGTEPASGVIPAASMKASNAPSEGASLVSRAAVTGEQSWEHLYQNPEFWAF